MLYKKALQELMKKGKKPTILVALILVWIVSIFSGLKILGSYANTPGEVGRNSTVWPRGSHIALPKDRRPTFVLFLHPKCSCSRASVGELDVLMARTNGKAHAYVVFVQPMGWTASEVKGQLWKEAISIPGVIPILDREGQEAQGFGVLTSGHLLAFDGEGRLAFTGGITASRGHMGDNSGLQSLIQFVNTGQGLLKQSNVFGCSLFSSHKKLEKNDS